MLKYLIFLIFVLTPFFRVQAGLDTDLSGRILLDVERNGEAWYVYPEDSRRYYLGRPADAFAIMRELGLGISEVNFQKLAKAGMPVAGDQRLARSLAGQIILQVEMNGEAWYVNPVDLKIYYLGRPADAFAIMRELGLGITRENLALIHKPGVYESLDKYSHYEYRKISTQSGEYGIDLVEIDLADPNLEIITSAAEPYPSRTNGQADNLQFGAMSLGEFILENQAFAGINATYFDTSSAKMNYYFYPLYGSASNELVNQDQLKYWTTGPIMAFDENNKFYYFKDSREFPAPGWSASGGESIADGFEKAHGVKLQAALGNKPRLIEGGMNLLIEWDIDDKQRNAKARRNAIAYKDNKIYLVIARNATVPDLADIMKAMQAEYALNLDGGYSAALWYNDEYMVRPGRDIANAVLFRKK